jgi:hypothetical protein
VYLSAEIAERYTFLQKFKVSAISAERIKGP